jgi:hypothetical protein
MRELSTIDRAAVLIHAATGDRYGDGSTVTDICVGYAEPGYGDHETVVVFGNWNPKRWPRNGEPELTKRENIGPRLADALDSIDVSLEWLDEWATCAECYRAMRTQADSYSWRMFGAFVEDAGYVCADCMKADPESYLDEYVNDPHRAITWLSGAELTALGFEQWEPGDPHRYENGWHPGQTDDPSAILTDIQGQRPELDVVFLLDESSQFYVGFSAWTRSA